MASRSAISAPYRLAGRDGASATTWPGSASPASAASRAEWRALSISSASRPLRLALPRLAPRNTTMVIVSLAVVRKRSTLRSLKSISNRSRLTLVTCASSAPAASARSTNSAANSTAGTSRGPLIAGCPLLPAESDPALQRRTTHADRDKLFLAAPCAFHPAQRVADMRDGLQHVEGHTRDRRVADGAP